MSKLIRILALLFVAIATVTVPARAGFDHEVVDDDVVWLENRFAFDGSDTPHVLYLVRRDPCPPWAFMGVMKYATKTGGTWIIEEIPHEPCNPHHDLAITCAADGTVHILFAVERDSDTDTIDLVYGVRDALGWSFETIDSALFGYRDPRIALGPDGVPRVSYGGYFPHALMYGVRTEDGWAVSVVDDQDSAGGYVDMTVDPSGRAVISYFAYGAGGQIRLARETASGWNIDVVDSGISFFGCTSLRVDSEGAPHLSYATTDGGLIYAKKPSGAWEITEVPVVDGFATSEVELDLNAQNLPHILFAGRASWNLHYVFFANGQWVHMEADEGPVGSHVNIEVDSEDKTHIAYLDDDNDDLIYATVVSASSVPEGGLGWEDARWSIHPNPSRDHVRVVLESEMGQFTSEVAGQFVADIMDLQGRRRASITPTTIEARSLGFAIPRGLDLSAGLYVLHLRGAGRHIATKKWMYIP